jgi:hypothetical protein
VAVSDLVKMTGYGTLFTYFKQVKDGDVPGSFAMAFGMPMDSYQGEFDPLKERPASTGPDAPAALPIEPGPLVFFDDFTVNSNRWSTTTTEESTRSFGDGVYRVGIHKSSWMIWNWVPGEYRDFVVEVEATMVGGPDANTFGLLFRGSGDDDFYRFALSSEGAYLFDQKKGGKWTTISAWKRSPAVKRGKATNVINVAAKGSTFVFSVNGEEVATVNHFDEAFTFGDLAYFAGTRGDRPGVEIAFDNLKVWQAQ